MTTGTEASPTNIDTLTSKAGNDTYNINGGYLLIDSHSRYGVNQSTSATLGAITGSASLGGGIEINSTKVRIIPYDTGSGNVPALDTTISIGSASGKLLGVYSALNVAPTAAASAMPASGYILIRQWNSVAYTTGTLTGITANATAADRAGWLEIVGTESSTITINRLNKFKIRGDWWDFLGTTTSGTRTTGYQLPTNGSLTYCAGIEVETAVGSGVYEFYPNAGSKTALVTNILTDSVRGKWCWVTTGGVVYLGYDGTNQTGAYCPVSGLKLRVPNIFLQNATSGAPTANVIPNTTITTRAEFLTSGGGVIDFDKVVSGWYLNFLQPFSVALTNVFTFDGVLLQECASAIAWSNVGVGMSAGVAQAALQMVLCFAGGTMDKCTWVRYSQGSTGNYSTTWQDCTGFTVTNERIYCLTKSGHATTGSLSMTRVVNSSWTTSRWIGGGRCLMIGCDTVTFTTTTYVDNIAKTTDLAGTNYPMYLWDLGTAASFRLTFDGVDFGGLSLAGPASGIINIGVAGCSYIKLRNLGTAASPLECGGPIAYGTWTRATTTTTVTKTAHGLKTGDVIAVIACTDVAPKALTTTSATTWALAGAPTADTFTVTVTSAGQTASQNLVYYPVLVNCLINTTASYAGANVYIQRCYTPHLRSGLVLSLDNSNKNVVLEDVWGPEWGAHLVPMLNCTNRGVRASPAFTSQTACYGTHWLDCYTNDNPASVSAVSWSRSSTTCTVTSNAHGLRVGNQILVTVTSDASAVVLGVKTLTQISAVASPVNMQNTFQFTCLNAGGASGTLTFTPLVARMAIQMNEATTQTSTQYTINAGAPVFTSAGTLYMPNVNDEITFTAPANIRGHDSFPIAEAVMGTGTITNYDITYSLDGGSTYKNLSYPRAGGGGTTNTTITMTSTTGVAVDDYVFGTNVAPLAKVTQVVNGTTIYVDKANTGTVSGILRFNHLPMETVSDPAVGTPLKVKFKTTTTNSTAIGYLYWFTYAGSTARATTYDLEMINVTVTVKDASTLAAIQNARVRLVTDTGGYVILTGLTNSSGVITGVTSYTGQAFSGVVRRASVEYGTLYKPNSIVGTLGTSDYSTTVLLTADE